jgi:hypothetical protein
MKLFLSWSGERSKIVAEALYDWLPTIMQAIVPWISSQDIEVGDRWGFEINQELQDRRFGILCITPENRNAPWVLFEAGALSKSLSESRVCPYLINLSKNELTGPLTQFQLVEAHREDTLKMVKTLNNHLEVPLPIDRLTRIFDSFWPNLEFTISALPPVSEEAKPMIQETELLQEILSILRRQSRDSLQEQTRHSQPLNQGYIGNSAELLEHFRQFIDDIPNYGWTTSPSYIILENGMIIPVINCEIKTEEDGAIIEKVFFKKGDKPFWLNRNEVRYYRSKLNA